MMIVRYYLAGRVLFDDLSDPVPPSIGDKLCLDGKYYRVADRFMHKPMCPGDFLTVHLEMAEPERVWPVGHP